MEKYGSLFENEICWILIPSAFLLRSCFLSFSPFHFKCVCLKSHHTMLNIHQFNHKCDMATPICRHRSTFSYKMKIKYDTSIRNHVLLATKWLSVEWLRRKFFVFKFILSKLKCSAFGVHFFVFSFKSFFKLPFWQIKWFLGGLKVKQSERATRHYVKAYTFTHR